jgi:tetratricopeptide (TPR) repeat protein
LKRSIRMTLCVLSLGVLVTGIGLGQERTRFQWPEQAKNLQVLPKDLGGQELREVMLGFSRALGVRCSHCHVGEPNQSLTEFDFASDQKSAKTTARTMIRMVRSINDDYLQAVVPSQGVRREVACFTCHRGVPRPGSVETLLWETAGREGIAAAVGQYHDLRQRYYGKGVYDFSEGMLNRLGYRFVGDGKADEALVIFRLNVEQFPEASNTWDSLADVYATQGDTVRAITFYRRSLELDPDNDNAVEQLKKLTMSEPAPN